MLGQSTNGEFAIGQIEDQQAVLKAARARFQVQQAASVRVNIITPVASSVSKRFPSQEQTNGN